MSSLISGSCLVHADILRVCFVLLFVGFAVAVHTARSEEGQFASDLDILTIQPMRSEAGWLFPYRLNTHVVLSHSEDSAPTGSKFSNTPQLYLVAEPKQEAVWPTNTRWQFSPDSDHDHVSLSALLRFGTKGERIEIKPRRHSIWVIWRKALP